MGDVLNPYIHHPPPPPPPPSQKSNLPMLYYGLVIIGTAAIVLAIYNLIIIKWCSNRHQDQQGQSQGRATRFLEATRASQNMELSSFKYKKDNNNNNGGQDQGSDYECAVCLSIFEEGEEVRKLPGCNHTFHASCIDMWLYSHSDCPLCRARVDPPPSFCHRHPVAAAGTPDNSRENLLGANAHFIPLV